MRNLQLADEHECRDILTTIGNLGQLALKVLNVGLEVVTLPHLNDEKMVIILLGF